MGYFLGIDLGASRTVAAVAWAGNGGAETVDLGDRDGGGEGVASVLHLGTDGTLAVGAAARGWVLTEPDRVVEGFPGRIGDDDPMLLAGEPWAPEELTAWLVRWVVDRVAEHEGTAADAVALVRPPSWDDARTALLAAAVAEQDLDVRFLVAQPDEAAGDDGVAQDGGAARAAAVAVALREAVDRGRPGATTASGRHAVVGGAIAALAGIPTEDDDPADGRSSAPSGRDGPGTDTNSPSGNGADSHGADSDRAVGDSAVGDSVEGHTPDGHGPDGEAPDDEGGDHRAVEVEQHQDPDPGGNAGQDQDPAGGPADTDGSASFASWDVPAPRSHASGAYDPTGSGAGGPDPDHRDPDPRDPNDADDPDDPGGPGGRGGPGRGGGGAEPPTRNLVAELVGFTGGMGATNTAGLLSGYTPAHGMPAAWSGGDVAVAPFETATDAEAAAGTSGAVVLPSQRESSGRWSAVAPEAVGLPAAAPALRARNNPTVLVGAGGLAAAVAVVGTLFLWPAPRITNSATSRPFPAVPVATATIEPTAAPTVALTPEPVPTRRPRPAAPRTRRPVVPPVTVPESATDTAPPTASAEPTEPTTSVRPSEEETAPTTKKADDD